MNYSIECGDCIEWLKNLPDDCADLLVTSPPYEAARTYSIGFSLRGQEWVDWMVDVVRAAAPKVRGLIAVNCEGQTRGYRYSATPFLLVADLHRAGFNLRKPVVFHRVGIPGSGGPDWLRNDWEPIICATRPGKLPWSNPTATGKPPMYKSGGKCTHRKADGERMCDRAAGKLGRLGAKYALPEIANPGNAIEYAERIWYTSVSLFAEVITYGHASETSPSEVLRSLQQAARSGSVYEWGLGVCARLHAAAVLRPSVYGAWRADALATAVPFLQDRVPPETLREFVLLSEVLLGESKEMRPDSGGGERFACGSQGDDGAESVREVWNSPDVGGSPQGRESTEQRPGESRNLMCDLPRGASQPAAAVPSDLRHLWHYRGEELQGIWDVVRQALPSLQEARFAAHSQGQGWGNVAADQRPDVIRCQVGGGRMGHALAHENEAPYPLKLAEFFVLSFCPPGGLVLDPFSGSGTTAHAAILHGRRFAGCDVRESQVELTKRRLATITPTLPLEDNDARHQSES